MLIFLTFYVFAGQLSVGRQSGSGQNSEKIEVYVNKNVYKRNKKFQEGE